MKLTAKKASVTQRVLVYGAPKTGKTELVGRLSEHYNLIWFDNEKGWSTLLKLPTAWQERINIISVPDSRVYPIAAESWLKIIKGPAIEICEIHGKCACAICKKNQAQLERVCMNEVGYDTVVVFDSLTQLTNSMISHITKAQDDDYKLQLDDWGNLRVLIDKFLSQVQAAGYNIACITHEEEVIMEDGKKKLVPSAGSSKSSMNTAKYFDHVVYCEVKNKKHVFGSSTDFGMNMVTGSRTGIALEKSAVPSLLEIFTSWKESPVIEQNMRVVESIELAPTEKQVKLAEISKAQEAARIEKKVTSIKIENKVDSVADLVGKEVKMTIETKVAKTPGQIALENLKAKAIQTLEKGNVS